ncbi:TPA: extracellular solute-binding protein [Streptococcus suis]|nr:extracellular solute-binding protein [Streptococcus suis]HEM3621770.1 extracellular solute-binding protein [Streptococcus suis]HEM3626214.1 extracellular solute-binding protein [Streptococcus suis]HEM3630857.1 extracellular solute-binding protein [Streptococcus suis]HEM3638882.1 extracellular solute-binding protein [Streptococcus suis]
MKMKTFLKCASVCAFASFLVACGNASSSDKVEIEYFSQKPEMQATLQEIIDDFEKENPTIDVKFSNVPDAGTVLKTRMANNEAPDVINIYPQNADFKAYAADGRFLEIGDDAGLNHLKDGAVTPYLVNEKNYTLPLTANAYGIYYNKDKFKELGLEVPTTYAEFEALVDKIKADGSAAPFALSLNDAWSLNGYHQLAWVTVAGGFDGAEDILIRSAKGAIQDDATTKAVLERLQLLTDNGQKGATGALYADAVAAFAAGDALMLPQGTWAATAVNQQEPEFEYGMFTFPGDKEGGDYTIGAADLALSISADTEHPEESKKFLEYLSRPEVMQKYYDVDGSPTSVEGVNTEGKFEETAGVTQYAFTDKHVVWLQSEWESEEEFWNITVEMVKNPNSAELVKKLNAFFDPMKK